MKPFDFIAFLACCWRWVASRQRLDALSAAGLINWRAIAAEASAFQDAEICGCTVCPRHSVPTQTNSRPSPSGITEWHGRVMPGKETT